MSIRETILKAKFLPSGETVERPEKFVFPEPIPLEKKLKDVLETEVDEKYYLDSKYEKLLKVNKNYGMMEGGVIGNMHESSRRAYSPDYVSPTIPTCAGGNIQPKVIEGATPLQREVCNKALKKGLVEPNDAVEYTYSNARLKEIEQGYIKKQNKADNRVMSTLKTNPQQIGICVDEAFTVASRGRNPDNPSDRTTGAPTAQRLEPRFDGCTNTLTSVQKDNYVALPGAYGRNFGSKGKIQNLSGESCTLQEAMGAGGGNVPLVPIKTANRQGYDLAADGDGADLAYPDSKTRRGRVGRGVAKTLPTSDSQGVLDGLRIRKLTPKECWRLMGFDDTDFEKAAKVNSNTQLYKQAGNSIVVNVLEAILANLLGGYYDK